MSRAPRIAAIEEPLPESDVFEGAPHPRDMLQLAGHREAERSIIDALYDGRMAQSWIIGGRAGIGKATLAWRIARFLLAHCDAVMPGARKPASLAVDAKDRAARRISALSHSDVFVLRREWNTSSKRHYTEIRVEDVRRLIERFQHASAEGGWRIAIIDCAEDLNKNSANALLKLIEEPPPRSLFLFVSHRPARMLATLRSRSRMLLLQPLDVAGVEQAIAGLGAPWSEFPQASIMAAAQRSGGSVRDALRLLSGAGLKMAAEVEGLLQPLPDIDWSRVHAFADKIGGRQDEDEFEAALNAIFDWIAARTVERAGRGGEDARPANLAPLAEVWEKSARSVRETEALNLDRRLLILTLFKDLSDATRRSP
ncbi:MAG: DNA polymerase III subunit delta' [Alphaproteobacteria bacterium]|nr:DNA polymerase III subunit delta' [Alphaproteobacteria bacterium]